MNDIVFAGKHFLTYNVRRHKHRNWELVYCTGAGGAFVFDQMRLAYGEGDVVVIPPGIPHENVSEKGFTNIHLNIDEAALPFSEPVLIRDDNNQSILHLFENAYCLYGGDPDLRRALLPAYGGLIVGHLTATPQDRPRNQAVAQITQSIAANYANAQFELDGVLRTMPYCYDHLCRLFRREVGTTPHKYLTQMRLEAAANLLRSPYVSGNIAEVAHMCGFENPLYFTRLFKRRYGMPPTQYSRLGNEAAPQDSDSQKILLTD